MVMVRFLLGHHPLFNMCLIKDKGYFVEILRALVFLVRRSIHSQLFLESVQSGAS